MNCKKDIIKSIEAMSGAHAPYEIFSDWVELCALSIQNTVVMIHDKVWKEREQRYIDTARKYTEEERIQFAKMFVWLGDTLTDELSDVLGEIYMTASMGNKYTGQFFTPFHLSELFARLGIKPNEIPEEGYIYLNEPSCGGGGMIIAACKVLREAGINYQRRLKVVAQDLDWKSVYMTYLQLSLIGCNAIVVQGDTLQEPYDTSRTPRNRLMRTPCNLGALI